jgi:uncharacterized membrane protein YfcA
MNYLLGLTIIGIISGLAGGLIGAGAEILIVPLLTIFKLLPSLKKSIGTSLFMLLPPIGIFAALEYYNNDYVDVKAAIYLGLLFTIFAWISSRYTIKINQKILQKIFGIFTIASGLYIFFSKNL